MNPNYPRIAERARHRCEYCLAPEAFFNFHFEVEHIIPVQKLIDASPEAELALACRSCNVHKSNFQTGPSDAGFVVDLFHPRVHIWSEHFELNLKSGVIYGLTPCGQATVNRVRMNTTKQIKARLLWIEFDLYPES